MYQCEASNQSAEHPSSKISFAMQPRLSIDELMESVMIGSGRFA